jgi:D-erythrulose 4-phosphate isomerase
LVKLAIIPLLRLRFHFFLARISVGDSGHGDYEDLADELAAGFYADPLERGVLVCSSAIGASVSANKYPGVYAAPCHDVYSALMASRTTATFW